MNNIEAAARLGQSIWLDNIERKMLGADGILATMIAQDGLRGVTSNPSIFEKAITHGEEYTVAIGAEEYRELSNSALFFQLAVEDIRDACDLFMPLYEQSGGENGFVSLEVSPSLAYDADGTIEEAKQLWSAIDRPNAMIKVPGTVEGLEAIGALTAEGINVNVTLIFSVERYRAVLEAYLQGLEARQKAGESIEQIASVASFFISRIDSVVDPKVAEIAPELKGKIAIDNARLAYQHYLSVVGSARFAALKGAKPQRLLWASTSVKDPAYRETLYVDELIGENTVNTLPPATYEAFKSAKRAPEVSIVNHIGAARERLAQLSALGIDLEAICADLEEAGVTQFIEAFDALLGAIEKVRV